MIHRAFQAAFLYLLFVPCAFAQTPSPTDSLIDAGFTHLRAYGETRDLADARKAHRAFSEALRKSPSQPRAHLGLGLAYTAVEGQQLDALGLNQATRVTNNTLAVRHLVEALKGEMDAASAAHALVAVARREYDVQRFNNAIAALEAAGGENEFVKAAIGELYIGTYRPERAEAVVLPGITPATQRVLGIAQLLQKGKVDQGGAAYLAALASADSITLREFYRDARWLADRGEAGIWKSLTPDELRERLRQFWDRRALRSAVTVPARLSTHFARVQHAADEFSYYRQRTATASARSVDVQMDGTEFDVDDRAFTYVRYGEPDKRIRTFDGAYPSNESWVYRRLADHPVSFDFFLLPNDARGWTLMSDVVRCAGGILPFSEAYLRDRQEVDPRYGQLLAACQPGRRIDPSDVQAIAQPFVKERHDFLSNAVVRDNGVPRSAREVPLLADVLQFSGDAEQTSVTAVVMWPLGAVTPRTDALGDVFSSRVTLLIADTLGGTTVRKDTTITFRRPAGNPAATARVYLTVNAPAARAAFYRITLLDLNADSVLTIVGDTIDVRPLASSALMVSDIALVSGTEGGSWRRADRRLSLLPQGTAPRDFSVYYEIYNVSAGVKYRTQITFEPQDEGLAKLLQKMKGTRVVSFSFEGESEQTTVRELQTIRSELPPGRYVMRITVTSGGQSTSQSRRLRIPQ